MKLKPMLFSAPMVRAMLEGRKTQTRRKIAPPPSTGAFCLVGDDDGDWWPYVSVDGESTLDQNGDERPMNCPHDVGSEIWVRETWATDRELDSMKPSQFVGWPVRYLADGAVLRHGAFFGEPNGKTRVSIFMPRWASRITLQVTDVRVQRLQDISEEDAIAEGILEDGAGWCGYKTAKVTGPWQRHPEDAYRDLWESINGSWDANPWVWAYTFEVKR